MGLDHLSMMEPSSQANIAASNSTILAHHTSYADDDVDDHDNRATGIAFSIVLLSGVILIVSTLALTITGKPFFVAVGYSLIIQLAFVALLLAAAFWLLSPGETRLPQPAATEPRQVSPFVDSVWKTFLARDAKQLEGRVAFYGRLDSSNSRIANDLTQEGFEVHLVSDSDTLFDCVSAKPSDWQLLMVDLDGYDDSDEAIDDLLAFRAESPETVVILLSSDVGRDDLSLERIAVADATIRKPISRSRLLNGIEAARDNSTRRDSVRYRGMSA